VKVNEFEPREVVDKLMKKANPVWQVILGLSRYGGLRTPSETLSLRWDDIDWEMNRMSIPEPKVEHHEGRGIRNCPIFPELRPILDEAFEIFGDKSEYVVAAPQFRAAANTAMGWKNANLRSEMTRLLRRAGVSGWPRLFHSMRGSLQFLILNTSALITIAAIRLPTRKRCQKTNFPAIRTNKPLAGA
jgi:integrase